MWTGQREVEKIIKKGKPVFIGCKNCKTFSKFLQSFIGQLTKKNEIQSRQVVELIQEQYFEHYPNERPGIKFNGQTNNYDINKSKINRYDWGSVFQHSLSTEIEKNYYKKRILVENAVYTIQKDPRVIEFIDKHPLDKKKILENIDTSVHSRYSDCKKFGDKHEEI